MADKQYLELVNHILTDGVNKQDRTGVGTLSVFGYQMRFNLEDGFPILTTKKIYWKGVVEELLWILRGETNSKILEKKNVNIWKGNTTREFLDNRGLSYPEGEIGPAYGFQLRNFNGSYRMAGGVNPYLSKMSNGEDQLRNVVENLKTNPDSRRHVVTLWNPLQVDKGALPPCHGCLIQFYVANNKLSCHMNQRSCDVGLGVPFNIASYALFTHIVAQICGYEVGELIWTGGDTHIYLNHIEPLKKQLTREPYPMPKIAIHADLQSVNDIDKLRYEDVELIGYQSHPKIKMEMAV